MDNFPAWLQSNPPITEPPKPALVEANINETHDHDVNLDELTDYLSTHLHVQPKHKRWTKAKLLAKKKSLIRKIEKEIAYQAEVSQLKEECCFLAAELSRIQSHNSSHKF